MKLSDIWYAFDFETSSVNKHACKIAGLGICKFNIKTGKILDKSYTNYNTEFLQSGHFSYLPMIYSANPIVAHNAPFDVPLLGPTVVDVESRINDTFLMAKHINNQWPNYSLKFLAWHFLGEPYLELLELKKWFRENGLTDDEEYMDMTLAPVELVSAYCLRDVITTAKLAHLFWKEIKDSYAYELDRQTIMRTVDTESYGIVADLKFAEDFVRRQNRRVTRNTKQARAEMGITDGKSPKGKALQERLANLGEERKTASGKFLRSDDPVLRDYKEDAAIRAVSRIRSDTSSVSGYPETILKIAVPLRGAPRYGRFYINLLQSSAVTRRYTGSGFYGAGGEIERGNPQNPPRKDKSDMRKIWCAPPGYDFWKLDLASIEARMFSSFMELLMGESTFADLYRKDPDFNPYIWVIEQCTHHGKVTKKHELYTPYKHGTLGRLYCSGPARLAIQLRDDFELDYTEDQCRQIYADLDRACPFIKKYQRFLLNLADSQGYIKDVFGAVYYRPSHKPYEIIAHLHQGAAAGVLKWWWNEIADDMKTAGDHVSNTVHDELDCHVLKKDRPAARVKGYCDALRGLDIFDLPILAEADKGKNWWECG